MGQNGLYLPVDSMPIKKMFTKLDYAELVKEYISDFTTRISQVEVVQLELCNKF